eukprot:200539_1
MQNLSPDSNPMVMKLELTRHLLYDLTSTLLLETEARAPLFWSLMTPLRNLALEYHRASFPDPFPPFFILPIPDEKPSDITVRQFPESEAAPPPPPPPEGGLGEGGLGEGGF